MLRSVQFNAPLGVLEFNVQGRFVLYSESNGGQLGLSSAIELWIDDQPAGRYLPGDSIELPRDARKFRVVPDVATLTGWLTIGTGRVRSSRLTGTVQVVNSEISEVLTGTRGFRIVARQAAATRFPMVGLWTQTHPIALNRIVVEGANGASAVRFFSSQGGHLAPITNQNLPNKYGLGVAGVQWPALPGVQVQTADLVGTGPVLAPDAGADFNDAFDLGWDITIAANQFRELALQGPIVINPGRGFWVVSQTAAARVALHLDATRL